MNFAAAERIAQALLYEGYLLYPYRASAVKNQRRWTFGCLFPEDFPQPENGAEGCFATTECLLSGDSRTEIEVQARFLQIVAGDEIVEREVSTGPLLVSELVQRQCQCPFEFAPIELAIRVAVARFRESLFKLSVHLYNMSPDLQGQRTREKSLPRALLSSHMILGLSHGKFFSMQDPPETVRESAASSRSVRAWPVLVGDPDRCDTMLAAPIILSDFPQVAAESPGDLFDATEMDEMLTLRIRTLTPDEKQEMAATDPRVESLLRRSDTMDESELGKLHGAWRVEGEPGRVSARSDPHIHPGMRVRLHPKGKADIYDLALAGKTAVVVSIEQDFEGRVYATVALDDDPGQDYGIAGRPGHRFYFGLDEVEPLKPYRILIAGIGNIFFGDDAFGVEVVRRLMSRPLPAGVVVKDFGIRGYDLACALQDGYDAAILVDAMQRGSEPGTLHVIEPDTDLLESAGPMEMHQLDPVRVFEMVRHMGGTLPHLRVVGCEPESLEPNDDGSLSEPVQNALPEAVCLIESIVADLLCGRPETGK